jgi:protein phosphatase
MSLNFQARTDTGRKREHNEDAFYVNEEELLFIVADGMGGQAAGETASSMAVKNIDEFIRNTKEGSEITWPTEYQTGLSRNGNRLEAAIRLAHRKIYDFSLTNPDLNGMGTTVVSVLFDRNNIMTTANVGDSRIYKINEDEIVQLTTDHSWVNEQVKLGLLTPEQAQNHPYRNVVTRALGGKDEFEVDIEDHELESDDIILLCSDGLTTMLKNERIKQIVNDNKKSLDVAVTELINHANAAGGDDNITVILINYTKS